MTTPQQIDLLDWIAERGMPVHERLHVMAARPRLQPMVDTPRARSTDPETSHAAAQNARGGVAQRQLIVLDAIKRWPGKTACELARELGERMEAGLDVSKWRHEVSRRAPELRGVHVMNGEPRICTVAGSRQMTWWPK